MQKIRLRNLALVVASTCTFTLCSHIYVTSVSPNNLPVVNGYPVVGTNQSTFFNNKSAIPSEDHERGWSAYAALDYSMDNDGTKTCADVHRPGTQPSDPKAGDPDEWTNDIPNRESIRIYNNTSCSRRLTSNSILKTQNHEKVKIKINDLLKRFIPDNIFIYWLFR